MARKELQIGDPAPDFDLPADGGARISLKALKGKRIVMYFYPKDNTSGCSKEAADFRDAHTKIHRSGAIVIGISRDSVKTHDGFKAKLDLNFPLASDEDGRVCEAYGTWVEKSMYGRRYMGIDRATFLIDEKGRIRGIWRKVKVPGHVDLVLEALHQMG